jgi:predicted fused transcriptional regulator/phosphomethylpyrimidine kinase/predicted transcriptional regulator
MKPPCELMVKAFLPATRALLAHRLKAAGFEQERVARLLGVTQAAVSYYLSTNPKRHRARLLDLGLKQDQVDSMLSDLVSAVQRGDSYATEVLYNYWRAVLSSGDLCAAHRALVGGLVDCDMCIRIMGNNPNTNERFSVLRRLKEAAGLLEASPTFGYFIPEVYSNLVYSVREPRRELDVAAIPGRIIRVKNRARAIMDPEFGASKHMATLILCLREENPWVRAALNIGYSEDYLDALRRVLPANVLRLGDYGAIDHFFEELRHAKLERPLGYLVDPGSRGLEPNIYIVGEDPITVANVAASASTIWFHSVGRKLS